MALRLSDSDFPPPQTSPVCPISQGWAGSLLFGVRELPRLLSPASAGRDPLCEIARLGLYGSSVGQLDQLERAYVTQVRAGRHEDASNS
jgi:hypothetical protein